MMTLDFENYPTQFDLKAAWVEQVHLDILEYKVHLEQLDQLSLEQRLKEVQSFKHKTTDLMTRLDMLPYMI